MFHYSGPTGQFQGLSPEQVITLVRSTPGVHQVWAPGMAGWLPVEQVPDLAARLAPASVPGGPPAFTASGPSAAVDGDPMAVYRTELDVLNRLSEREGGGSDFDWWAPGKPANVGQSIMSSFRLTPMPFVDGNGSPVIDQRTGLPQRAKKFWTRATRHQVKMSDGTSKSFVCHDDHDDPNAPKQCPLCALSRALYDTRDKGLGEAAREMRAQHRCYANIIDLQDTGSHWTQVPNPDGTQGYRVRSKVWGFSKQLHQSLMQIAVAKGCFLEDPVHGRNLTLICNRIGKQARDIRYSVTDSDPTALDTQLYPVIQGAHNLDALANPTALEELARVAAEIDPRPRNQRSGPAYTPGAQASAPAGYGGPPQGFPAPAPAPMPPGYVSPPAAAPPAYAGPLAGGPPAPAAGPPPGFPPAPAVPVVRFKYHGASGTADGLSPDDIAQRVVGGPGPHYVWTEGQTEWKDAESVPALTPAISARRSPPTSVPPPVAGPTSAAPTAPPMPPPGSPGGPPSGPPVGPPGAPPSPPGAQTAW